MSSSKIILAIWMIIRCIFCAVILIPLLIALKIGDWFYNYSWGFRLFHRVLFWMYRVGLWFAWIPVTYKGKFPIAPPPAIVVANHQSSLDIVLIGALTNGAAHFWFAKDELGTTGSSIFIRWILKRIAILVNLDDHPFARMKTLLQAIKQTSEHQPYIILFPEGGRYTDGRVHEFFAGFATLARKTGLPVIPIYLEGVSAVLPPGAVVLRHSPVQVTIGESFVPSEQEDDAAFTARVWNWFQETQKSRS